MRRNHKGSSFTHLELNASHIVAAPVKNGFVLQGKFYKRVKKFHKILLWSDIRSARSIAIFKKFDLDFLMIFDSTALPESKNVF